MHYMRYDNEGHVDEEVKRRRMKKTLELLKSCRDTCKGPVYTAWQQDFMQYMAYHAASAPFVCGQGVGCMLHSGALIYFVLKYLRELFYLRDNVGVTDAESVLLMDIDDIYDCICSGEYVDEKWKRAFDKWFKVTEVNDRLSVEFVVNSKELKYFTELRIGAVIDTYFEFMKEHPFELRPELLHKSNLADTIDKSVKSNRLTTETKELLNAFDRVLDGGVVFTLGDSYSEDISMFLHDTVLRYGDKPNLQVPESYCGNKNVFLQAKAIRGRWSNVYDVSEEDINNAFMKKVPDISDDAFTEYCNKTASFLLGELMYHKASLYKVADEYALVYLPDIDDDADDDSVEMRRTPFVLLRYKNSKGVDMLYIRTYRFCYDGYAYSDNIRLNKTFDILNAPYVFEHEGDTPLDIVMRAKELSAKPQVGVKEGIPTFVTACFSENAYTFAASDKSPDNVTLCGENGVICPFAKICESAYFSNSKFNTKRCKKCIGITLGYFYADDDKSEIVCPVARDIVMTFGAELLANSYMMDKLLKVYDSDLVSIALSNTINKSLDLDEPCLTVLDLSVDALDWLEPDCTEILDTEDE